ncbi:hypothetical protein A7K91_12545 [Paenibacillus oryzae]|uniref:Methyltransferase type 11 domain-containing protein n=1 Tax=Paenibacillus oryzae TaxID=1844972 RepID=A0A1A5YFH6_9BACL|nr:class I SAM-dependent methyltransferase [Paenibacillus oryzae]OBR64338.1 hypothetical protein A7K91_12545 [Paenibacillus oryzae]
MFERFYPNKRDISYYEHNHRYHLASSFAKDKRILDIACGEGYGTHFLSQFASEIIGVDVDSQTIKTAQGKYLNPNLEYKVDDINKLSFDEGYFDIVVCFETIEHVPDPFTALNNLKRVLKKDGVLIISTPNKAVYSDEKQFNNPHHIYEFYFTDFQESLEKCFPKIEIYGQRVVRGSYVWELNRLDSNINNMNNGILLPMYYIAVCSEEIIERQIKSSFYCDEFVDFEIDQAKQIIAQKDVELMEAQRHSANKDDEIYSAKKVIDDKEIEIDKARNNINSLVSNVNTLENEINKLVEWNNTLKKEIQVSQNALREKIFEIDKLKSVIDDYAEQIDAARNNNQLKDLEIENARVVIEMKNTELGNAKNVISDLWQQIESAKAVIDDKERELSKARNIITENQKL